MSQKRRLPATRGPSRSEQASILLAYPPSDSIRYARRKTAMPNQWRSCQVSRIPRRSAWRSSTGFSVRRPIIIVITARQWPRSTPSRWASSMPSMAARADAMICGRVKQTVVLVGMPLAVSCFTTSMPCMLAGTLIITFGLRLVSSTASWTIRSVSVNSRGSSWPEMNPNRPWDRLEHGQEHLGTATDDLLVRQPGQLVNVRTGLLGDELVDPGGPVRHVGLDRLPREGRVGRAAAEQAGTRVGRVVEPRELLLQAPASAPARRR